MRRLVGAFFVAASLVIGATIAAGPSYAEGTGGCPVGQVPDPAVPGACVVSVGTGGGSTEPTPGGGGNTGGSVGDPGPRQCSATGTGVLGSQKTIRKAGPLPCVNNRGAIWDDAHQCYMSEYRGEPGHPEGEIWNNGSLVEPKNDIGTYYGCDGASYVDAAQVPIWLDVPPGTPTITPAQAAAELMKRFQFKGVDVGIVPKNQPGFQGSVGLPVWMWVNNPGQDSYGPWTQSDTIQGLAVTATARVTRIDWGMGDGQVVSCANIGTPYVTAYGLQQSPTCGYVYQTMSKSLAGGMYTVTATSHWEFQWAAGGQTGTDTTTAQSVTQIAIGELQSVNVKNPGQG
ncbi:hypothetical protein ARUE_113p00900 (plasmid) [Arthrobacter sp. Rue61a]|nr:hypothetical protein ARUE_113p00900 [Arthrobacter sp. Rue61a]